MSAEANLNNCNRFLLEGLLCETKYYTINKLSINNNLLTRSNYRDTLHVISFIHI